MSDPMDEIVARVYGVPPGEFIAVRSEEAARAKRAGDAQLAAEIGKLRKPTMAAWVVNQLAHQRPDLVTELLDLADELREAQRQLRGAELRELSNRRRTTVAKLVREARQLAVDAGRSVHEKLPLAEVEQTLTAVLSDETVAEEFRAGRLVRPLEYAGFGETPRPQLRLVQGGPSAKAPPDKRKEPEKASLDQRKAQEEAERKAKEREEAVERAKAVKAAQRELHALEIELIDAETARDKAAKALSVAEAGVRTAQQKVDRARAKLERLDPV